ncbi:pathogen-related protein-like [Heracleum sosnowskyi]|uniref:Pathogen-related protein-like n=1 Tax=Heracleum sosnowskyi TaxID=360622 RepID=A0AAD8MXX8_9APIA|nr:pathogen-related protein-like [Heracleum sosnowskyi]
MQGLQYYASQLAISMDDEKRSIKLAEDKYRSFLHDAEAETQWRNGAPPSFDQVNLLFEEGRTKAWPEGSLEDTVQNAIKSWEMELSHKTRLQDFRSINPDKFKLIVNGKEGLSGEETLEMGSYNALLKNSLPEELKYYKAEEESFESSHDAFQSAFPRGFAWEVLGVYSGPPTIAYKFRHWGFFEGPFKGHAPTGKMAQFYGMGVLKVDEALRAEDVEIYYDPAELFSGLLNGPPLSADHEQLDSSRDNVASSTKTTSTKRCPLH